MLDKQPEAMAESIDVRTPPFETKALRAALKAYLDKEFAGRRVGDFKFGVYAFYDYDGEPIYVGQTNERLRTRIQRHLTNQRTDAVAMNVLDPFEVYAVEVWPLPQLEDSGTGNEEAKRVLNDLEGAVYLHLLADSKFEAVLNEKVPPAPCAQVKLPASCKGIVVKDEVRKIRGHPDVRLARRALVISRLAQVISERQVKTGLRKTLLVQAKRLESLAADRLAAFEKPSQ